MCYDFSIYTYVVNLLLERISIISPSLGSSSFADGREKSHARWSNSAYNSVRNKTETLATHTDCLPIRESVQLQSALLRFESHMVAQRLVAAVLHRL